MEMNPDNALPVMAVQILPYHGSLTYCPEEYVSKIPPAKAGS